MNYSNEKNAGQDLNDLVQQDVVVDFLAWLYGDENLFRGPTGLRYPLTVRTEVATNPQMILGDWEKESRTFPESSWLLEEMKQKNSYLWNGKTYALRSVDSTEMENIGAGNVEADSTADSDLSNQKYYLQFTTGSYFDTINTCTILEVELQRAIASLPLNASHQDRYRAMPLRQALHGEKKGAKALEDAWLGRDRSAAIAISCLFAVYNGQDYCYFVRQRAGNLADGAGQYHIVPSMVFQPTNKDTASPDSYNLQNMILREVAEELFDREEGDQNILSHPEIADLQSLLYTGGASLQISGIAMDLLCLRPEILAVLTVHDSKWLARHASSICFSHHEYVQSQSENEGWYSVSDDALFLRGGELEPRHCVASGAASAILGLPFVR